MKKALLRLADGLGVYPLFNRYTENTATVFMLHRFTPAGVELPDCTSAGLLAEFLGFLKANDYTVLPLSGYVDALQEGRGTRKAVVLTVDDGYRDFYDHAYPVLRRFGYSAAVFLTSDFIEGRLFFWWDAIEYVFAKTSRGEFELPFLGPGKFAAGDSRRRAELIARVTEHCKRLPNEEKLALIRALGERLGVPIPAAPPAEYAPLDWPRIKEMRSQGIEFYPHTVTHPILARVPLAQQRDEVCRSRAVLEEHLDAACDIFCYPNGGPGDFTNETIEALKAAGYRAAVTGIAGFDSTRRPVDLFRIRRFSIPPTLALFKQYVSGLENFKGRVLTRG